MNLTWKKYEPPEKVDELADLRTEMKAHPGQVYEVEGYEPPAHGSALGVVRGDVALQEALGPGFVVTRGELGAYLAKFSETMRDD